MSTVVASYTHVCRSPALAASSGTPASRSWRPAVAFPASVAVKCRRPLSVTCAIPEKQRPAVSIPPTALLYPVPPPDVKERWDIKEEDDHVKLWFQVPGLSEEDLEITAWEDMLEIKGKGARAGAGVYNNGEAPAADVHGVGIFHARLLVTKEYDSSKVTAELKAGMLEVTVGKSRNRKISFGPRSLAQPANSPDAGPTQGRTPNTSPNQTQRDSMQMVALNQAQGGVGQYKNQDGSA